MRFRRSHAVVLSEIRATTFTGLQSGQPCPSTLRLARQLFYQLVGHWLQARAYRTGRGARAQLASAALRADEAPQRLHVCVSESSLAHSCPSAIAIACSDGGNPRRINAVAISSVGVDQLPVRMAIASYWELLGAIGCYAGSDLAIGSYWELLAACARAMLPCRIARTQLCSINKKSKPNVGSLFSK